MQPARRYFPRSSFIIHWQTFEAFVPLLRQDSSGSLRESNGGHRTNLVERQENGWRAVTANAQRSGRHGLSSDGGGYNEPYTGGKESDSPQPESNYKDLRASSYS